MSHTDKAFIKAFRAAGTSGAKRVPQANPSAPTLVDVPHEPVAEPTPVATTPVTTTPAPVASALTPEPERAPMRPLSSLIERARPKLARDEEAFLAGDASAAVESHDESPAPPSEPTRSESRWKPDVFAQAPTIVSEAPAPAPEPVVKPEPIAKSEPVAKPAPRAYIDPEPAEEAEPESPRVAEGSPAAYPPPRGVHSLAEITQISTAVTDWGPAEKVERFEFPEVCDSLLEIAGHEFAALADEIAVRSKEGEKLYLAASCQGNEGATTVVLCLARTLAARGLRTVVVDQDVTHPGLAEALHLHPSTGWAEVLSGEAALAEALVESEEEPLAVLPMCTSDQPQAIAPAARQRLCLGLLKQHFDVVLLDAGPLHLTPHEQLAQPLLDAAIIVYDPQSSADAELDDAIARLGEAGLPLAAVAENFYVDVA